MNKSFQIFKSDNKTFHWDENNGVLVCILILGFIIILEISVVSEIARFTQMIILLLFFLLTYFNIFRKKPLNGSFEGILTFNEEYIEVDGFKILISDVAKLFLRINDYEGQTSLIQRPSLFPKISNGTNNLLDLNLKNGKKVKVFFKIEDEIGNEGIKTLIKKWVKNEKMIYKIVNNGFNLSREV